MNANATIDSLMQSTVNRNLVKWAAGHVLTCPCCDKILDCRSTVVASRNTGAQLVICASCWDEKTERHAYNEIVDGRTLWTAPTPRKPSVKAKYTFAQRIERGLIASGWARDYSDKSRYTAWIKPGEVNKLFTGPSGALRKGQCASRSYSIGDPSNQRSLYADLLSLGERELDIERLAKK